MKKHTPIEILRAREKVPRAVDDFLNSTNLQTIIDGILNKSGLSGEQASLLNNLILSTILELESANAIEANVHQCFPELSNEKTRELVTDIQDRILKEVKRRVDENITDPKFNWDERTLGKKPTVDQLEALKKRFHEETQKNTPAEELTKIAREDARKQQEQEELEEAEYIAGKKSRGEALLSERGGGDVANTTTASPVKITLSASVPVVSRAPEPLSIASQKLSVPSAQPSIRTEVTTIENPTSPLSSSEPKSETLPRIEKKPDPYRELVD